MQLQDNRAAHRKYWSQDDQQIEMMRHRLSGDVIPDGHGKHRRGSLDEILRDVGAAVLRARAQATHILVGRAR